MNSEINPNENLEELQEETPIDLPVAEEPVAEEPVAEEPVAEEPVAEEPVAEEPVAEEPVAEEPVAEEPVAEEPVAEEPVAEEPVAEEPVAEEPVAEEPVAEEPVAPELNRKQLLKEIARLESEIEKLANGASESDRLMEVEGAKLEDHIKTKEEFSDWVNKRRASYAWKLLDRLESYRKDLAADEKLIRDFSESVPSIPEGFGESMRKWFMKRFWWNFSISWGAILILLLINKFSDQLSSAMAKAFNGRSFLKYGLDYFLRQAIGMSLPQVIATILGFSLIGFIGLLFAYSRKNSEYQQLVVEENARTKAMEDGISEVKEGRERLDSLHPQVPQVLEVLSLGLHHPWQIDNASLMFNGSIPDTFKLPASVEVAVPTIQTNSPKYEELVFKAMNEIQTPAWRSDALTMILQRLAESIGFGANDMALRELDEDQRKTGKRQLVLSAGKNPEPATFVGEELVEKFTKVVQEKVLPFAQPQVVSLRPNPLEGLRLDGSIGNSNTANISNWQEKLAEIADLASPWSVSSFSNKGTAANKHQFVESIFIASDRVPSKDGVVKTDAVNPGARPFEVSIRVDLSQWCKPDEVAIFSDFKPTQEQLERWAKGGSTHGQVVNAPDAGMQPPQENVGIVV